MADMPFIFAFGRNIGAGKAVLFYLFWFVANVILAAFAGLLFGIAWAFTRNDATNFEVYFERGVAVGAVTAIVVCTLLAAAIVTARRAWRRPRVVFLAATTPFAAYLLGALLGCVPLALLMMTDGETPTPPPGKDPLRG